MSRSRDGNGDGRRVPVRIISTNTNDALSVTSTRVTGGLSATIISLLVNNDSATNHGLSTSKRNKGASVIEPSTVAIKSAQVGQITDVTSARGRESVADVVGVVVTTSGSTVDVGNITVLVNMETVR